MAFHLHVQMRKQMSFHPNILWQLSGRKAKVFALQYESGWRSRLWELIYKLLSLWKFHTSLTCPERSPTTTNLLHGVHVIASKVSPKRKDETSSFLKSLTHIITFYLSLVFEDFFLTILWSLMYFTCPKMWRHESSPSARLWAEDLDRTLGFDKTEPFREKLLKHDRLKKSQQNNLRFNDGMGEDVKKFSSSFKRFPCSKIGCFLIWIKIGPYGGPSTNVHIFSY